MHYIGNMYLLAYENYAALPSACPQVTPCTAAQLPPLNLDATEIQQTPAVFYHDLRFEFNLNQQFQFYIGVDNVLDTHPPYGLTGTGGIGATNDRGGGGVSAIYDSFGRKVYGGFRARF